MYKNLFTKTNVAMPVDNELMHLGPDRKWLPFSFISIITTNKLLGLFGSQHNSLLLDGLCTCSNLSFK